MEQKRNIVLGPAYAVRLEQLEADHFVEVRCAQCKRMVWLPAQMVTRGRSPHTKLNDLIKRFRCKTCGNRKDNIWRVLG